MVVIRNSMISKLSCVLAVAVMATVDVAPVQAQQYAGTRNSRQGTIGDISNKKLTAQIVKLSGLNFRPMGLFGDAGFDDPFRPFEQPSLFIYALPNFADAGLDFNGMSFDEYLTLVANSYTHTNSSDYLFRFQFQNEVSAANPGFVPDFNQVIQVHQQDFLAGGGFLPLPDDAVTPVIPVPDGPEEPPVFTPFPTGEPAEDTTDDPTDNTSSDTSAASLLEGSGVLTDIELADALDILNQASASESAPESAPVVSAVPEPATLGLLIAAGTALIGRRRR